MGVDLLQLPEMQISDMQVDGDRLQIEIARALIQKSLTGSDEQTLWWQAGTLELAGYEDELELPGECVVEGGDLRDNMYTYRDIFQLPVNSRGQISLLLRIQGREAPLVLEGDQVRLDLHGDAKYIRHIRPGDDQ